MVRVFNDDCCSVLYSQTFQDLIKGKKAIIVSDPPFNVGYENYFEIARQRLNENYQQITLEELADGRTIDHI